MAELVLPVTQEDYEKSGSKFASPGSHLSEITEVPAWKTQGKSLKFAFKIIEEGEDFGKVSELTAGIDSKGIWKLKEILIALGITPVFIKAKDGAMRPKFDPVECLGKQFKSVWEEAVDTRTPEEGGKGTKYTKPVGAVSVTSDVAEAAF